MINDESGSCPFGTVFWRGQVLIPHVCRLRGSLMAVAGKYTARENFCAETGSYTARGTVLCIARQHRKGRPPTRLLARRLKPNVIK
jgi:hypothetical protein